MMLEFTKDFREMVPMPRIKRGVGMCLVVGLSTMASAAAAPCVPEPLGHFENSAGTRGDILGCSISISGDNGLVGSSGSNNNTGAALVIIRRGGGWVGGVRMTLSDGAPGDQFGSCVCLDGGTAVVGAFGKDKCKGAAYIFVRTANGWAITITSTGVDCCAPPPSLSIAPMPPNVLLSWPAPSAGFTLQATPGFSPTNWTGVTNTVIATNGSNTVKLGATNSNRFFRLKK